MVEIFFVKVYLTVKEQFWEKRDIINPNLPAPPEFRSFWNNDIFTF